MNIQSLRKAAAEVFPLDKRNAAAYAVVTGVAAFVYWGMKKLCDAISSPVKEWSYPIALLAACALLMALLYGWLAWRRITDPTYELRKDVAREGRGYETFAEAAKESIYITHADDDWPSERLKTTYKTLLDHGGAIQRIIFLRENADERAYSWIPVFGTNPHLVQRMVRPASGRVQLPFSFAVIDREIVLLSLREPHNPEEYRDKRMLTDLAVIRCRQTAASFIQVFDDLWGAAEPLKDMNDLRQLATKRSQLTLCRQGAQIERIVEGDKSKVLRMCEELREDHSSDAPKFPEFIVFNIDSWIALSNAHQGCFMKAVLKDRVVGCLNIGLLNPEEAMLEAARVLPRYRSRGLAQYMYDDALEETMKNRQSELTVRAWVDADNDDGMGFIRRVLKVQEPVCAFHTCEGRAQCSNVSTLPAEATALTSDDAPNAWAFLKGHPSFVSRNGLISEGWRVQRLNESMLNGLIQEGNTYAVKKGGRISGLVTARNKRSLVRKSTVEIPIFIATELGDYSVLLNTARFACRGSAPESFLIPFIFQQEIVHWLHSEGLMVPRNHNDFIFEKHIFPL